MATELTQQKGYCIYFFIDSLQYVTSFWKKSLIQTLQDHANGDNKSNILSQQCWELLALLAWCLQTNATTANIVGGGMKKQRILVQ